MDTRLLDTLRQAPTIDLYELSVALEQLLADPKRILDIRMNLHLGASVQYFNHVSNKLLPARVVQMQPKYIVIQDEVSNVRWKLPYTAILAERSQHPQPAATPLPPKPDISHFAVGDMVCFTDKYLNEHVGKITRLNAKTCSVLVGSEQWRVGPGLLRKIIDL